MRKKRLRMQASKALADKATKTVAEKATVVEKATKAVAEKAARAVADKFVTVGQLFDEPNEHFAPDALGPRLLCACRRRGK